MIGQDSHEVPFVSRRTVTLPQPLLARLLGAGLPGHMLAAGDLLVATGAEARKGDLIPEVPSIRILPNRRVFCRMPGSGPSLTSARSAAMSASKEGPDQRTCGCQGQPLTRCGHQSRTVLVAAHAARLVVWKTSCFALRDEQGYSASPALFGGP